MDSKFNPPKDKKEFIERQAKIDTKAALSILNALRHRRASAVRALDVEIEFYEAALEYRKNGDVDYPKKQQ